MSAGVFDRRRAGCLCHVTSLPGPGPTGDLGPGARRFVGWLGRAGFTWWQVLPLHPPDPFGSPYPARSVLAGHPGLLSLEDLAADGLLTRAELVRCPARRRVDFAAAEGHRAALELAYARYAGSARLRAPFEAELEGIADWVDDWALFAALAAESGRPWSRWPKALRERQPGALGRARRRLRPAIELERFLQLAFQRQWRRLITAAGDAGVRLIGDLPMFAAPDGADAWLHPELLGLDARGRPRWTAGTPPDAFSASGQNWGVPVWDWEACAAEDWTFWRRRVARELQLVDALRLDHFLGFVRTWRHPVRPARRGSETASAHYAPGPGRALFDALADDHPDLPFAAEDLGDVTPEARALLAELGFPGMRILQYGFDGSTRDNPHRLHLWPVDSIGYTGTHDNDTWAGWYGKLPAGRRTTPPERATKRAVRTALGGTAPEIHRAAFRAVATSAARTVVLPVQDLLGLPSRARMNRPGTVRGNWAFRLLPRELTDGRARSLREVLQLAGRADAPS